MFNIGIDYTSAVQQSAGIGRYTQEMVRALANLTPTGPAPHYHLFVAGVESNFTPPCSCDRLSWHSTRLSERWLARLWYRLQLPLAVDYWTGPLDLFHAPDFFLPPVKSGIPTVVTIHDLSYVHAPETVMPGMSKPLNQRVPRAIERADHVVAVSEATRQDVIKVYGTDPKKITTLYHAVTAEFQPVTDKNMLDKLRQTYNLGENPFILSVSTIQPRKNYQRLIRAFAQLDRSHTLVIAGTKGWDYEPVLAEVAAHNLEDRVIFPGYVVDSDLPALYSAADLFVYPSLYEGFGLPILEAMACGTPVVAANRAALPEVTGEAGLLVDPYDVAALAEVAVHNLEDRVIFPGYVVDSDLPALYSAADLFV
ncbi:MAG: glycosyltransferase, partial [Anaerolineae bacterium]|nr:glycosyltransferase [Anaerolineae bacterium]